MNIFIEVARGSLYGIQIENDSKSQEDCIVALGKTAGVEGNCRGCSPLHRVRAQLQEDRINRLEELAEMDWTTFKKNYGTL